MIALHNGHNGWPTDSELSSLTNLIISVGFLPHLDNGFTVLKDFDEKQNLNRNESQNQNQNQQRKSNIR